MAPVRQSGPSETATTRMARMLRLISLDRLQWRANHPSTSDRKGYTRAMPTGSFTLLKQSGRVGVSKSEGSHKTRPGEKLDADQSTGLPRSRLSPLASPEIFL